MGTYYSKKSSRKYDFSNDELSNYDKILKDTNVIFHGNNPNNRPKISGGKKYNIFIKPIYKEIKAEKEATGEGIVVIPSDPNALLERLDLLMASKKAGNTGLRNELVSICDELKRQGVLSLSHYKNLMSILLNDYITKKRI